MILRIGDVEIDDAAREVRRRGVLVEAEPKVFDVLVYLVRHRQRVVTKEELLDALWEGRAVSDSVMARAIHGARKLAGDAQAIKTLYGRGYRFVGAVAANGEMDAHLVSDTALGASSASSIRPPRRSTLIGRTTEMAAAAECVESAVRGTMSLLTVTGEAGIGKTALCEGIASLAEERGVHALWGRCSEVPGAPAYWPFIQILRELIQCPWLECREEVLSTHPEARELVAPGAFASAGLANDTEQARFRLFDSVSQLVLRVSRTQPLALFIDDLHCADTPSLLLLNVLVQQLAHARLLMICAYRDAEMESDETRARWIHDLARQTGVRSAALRGLETGEVGAFVERVTGTLPDAASIAYLVEQTAGNPFYLSQLVPLLAARAVGPEASGSPHVPTALPRSARAAVESHLGALSAESRRALEAAAVVGREFRLRVLAEVLGVESDTLLELLEHPLDACLVVESSDSLDALRFAHVLVRDTVYAGLGAPTRSDLHRAVGEALERLAGSDLDSVATELSYHFTHAATAADAEKALRYSILAGDLALKRLAYEDASRMFEAALASLERARTGDEHLRCDLLLKLASARTRSGELDAARDTFGRAADLARRINAPERLATVALELSPGFFSIESGIVDEYLIGRLEEALAALGQDDSALRARLLGRLAIALYSKDQAERRIALCDEADRIATRLGTAEARLHALGARHAALWSPLNAAERLIWSAELVQTAEALGDTDALLVNRCFRITNLLERGDMDSVRAEVARFRKIAHAARQPECRWMAEMFDVMLALARGEFTTVEQFGAQSIELGMRLRHHNAVQTGGVYLAIARGELGTIAELLPALESNIESYPNSAWWGLYTMACMRAGDEPRTRRALSRTMAMLPQGTPHLTWLPSFCVMCEVTAYLGSGAEARILRERIGGLTKRYVVIGYGIATIGALDRYLGLAALAEERWTDAAEHLETAIEQNLEAELPAQVAHARRELAVALTRRGGADDRARATRLLEESVAAGRKLGMTWLLDQVERT